jgi:transposase
MTTFIDDLVPDELWALVEPLLPAPPRPPYGGRRRTISDRACFAAIVYMARTSTPWRLLPARELGCGSSATCWRRTRPAKLYADNWRRDNRAAAVAQVRRAARVSSVGATTLASCRWVRVATVVSGW